MRAHFVIIAIATGLFSCCSREATPGLPKATKPAETKAPSTLAVGRFVVLSTESSIIRMDTSTGETWRLILRDGPRWESVEDNLRPVGKYNAETKKIEWGTPLPDGTDLHDLSKEEILRWVEPILKRNPESNPRDPLGLFEKPEVRQE